MTPAEWSKKIAVTDRELLDLTREEQDAIANAPNPVRYTRGTSEQKKERRKLKEIGDNI